MFTTAPQVVSVELSDAEKEEIKNTVSVNIVEEQLEPYLPNFEEIMRKQNGYFKF